MGKADTVTKAFMRKNEIFADAFNFLIYDGASVVSPQNLKELDTTELALPYGDNQNNHSEGESIQKYRDILT